MGGHMLSGVGGSRRTAQDSEGGGAEETGEGAAAAEVASSLSAAAVVNFQILGNELAPNVSSGELMALLSRMGAEGYLWPLGVRALKTASTPWLIVGRDCARGDRYNDPPCTGRGTCVSGVCVCEDNYSGERCETRAAFDSRVLASLASWVRLVAAAILGGGVVCHLLSWVIAGGLRLTNQPVAGDYWSLVTSPPPVSNLTRLQWTPPSSFCLPSLVALTPSLPFRFRDVVLVTIFSFPYSTRTPRPQVIGLQFVATSCFLDTSLPTQYFAFASYFRIFALQFDPKDVVEWLGLRWLDLVPTPLTNACYESAANVSHPRQELVAALAAAGSESADIAAGLLAPPPPPGSRLFLDLLIAKPTASLDNATVFTRSNRILVKTSEVLEGWGGNVGEDPVRGALEVSMRLLCGTLLASYAMLLLAFVSRSLLRVLISRLRRRGYRRKRLIHFREAEALHRSLTAPQEDLAAADVEAAGNEREGTEGDGGEKVSPEEGAGAPGEALSDDEPRADKVRVEGEKFGCLDAAEGPACGHDAATSASQDAGDAEVFMLHVSGCNMGSGSGRGGEHDGEQASVAARVEEGLKSGGAEEGGVEAGEGRESGQDTGAIDPDALCAVCGEQGHWHEACPQLGDALADTRDFKEIVPADFNFPRFSISDCLSGHHPSPSRLQKPGATSHPHALPSAWQYLLCSRVATIRAPRLAY